MIFYEVELLSVPKIRFSLSVVANKMKNRFEYIKNFIEICIVEEGRIKYKNFDGTTTVICPGTISPILSDCGFDIKSIDPGVQRHTTVGVDVKYTFRKCTSSDDYNIEELNQKSKEKSIILIPCWQYLEDPYYDKVLQHIKSINRYHRISGPANNTKAIGKWYSLTGLLTEYVINELVKEQKNLQPSYYRYTQKCEEYISAHYRERISVASICDAIGLSEGHLQRIFKSAKGISLVEYINHYKVSAAISLMKNQNLSLKEAAYNIGIDDPSYMSRLFKKVTGMSCTQYFNEHPKNI